MLMRISAANALNASATIFESMVEVDTKFAKYADKECDSVSAEVKKWFKKLAVSAFCHYPGCICKMPIVNG